ncbi:MAG: aminotransferase class I/II-fold pyridoxal phosphate-dependent enzyme [Christensenellales bacterium]|jgi:aminotransferase
MSMEGKISRRVSEAPLSGIRKFFDIASEMKDVISLSVGEPDFVTPWGIREAAIYSIERGRTHYTSNHGLMELRRNICSYMSRRFDLSYEPNEVIATVGASEGIDLALRAIIEPGDEVLVPAPSYVSYMPCVMFAGGTAVALETKADNGFIITPEAIRAAVTPKTKAIVVPYPNNPTGAIMKKDQLEAIADEIIKNDLVVISDEIYAELTYAGRHVSIASLPGMEERTIVLNGFSKAFAMTGWRIGYACAKGPLIAAMLKLHQYVMLCAPIMSQIAANEALSAGLENGFEQVLSMVAQYNRRRRITVGAFNAMGLSCFEPLGAFYVFPCISSTGLTSDEFCHRLLMEKHVAMVPGTAFGESGEGFIRCSYAASVDNINEAMKRTAAFVDELKAGKKIG